MVSTTELGAYLNERYKPLDPAGKIRIVDL
jgi:hypothetical protein